MTFRYNRQYAEAYRGVKRRNPSSRTLLNYEAQVRSKGQISNPYEPMARRLAKYRLYRVRIWRKYWLRKDAKRRKQTRLNRRYGFTQHAGAA